MQSMDHVREKRHIAQIEFDPHFDYVGLQNDIFSLIDSVEEKLREVDLKEGVSGTAVLGYSTMLVVRSRALLSPKRMRTLYPIAFRIELKYKDAVVGELERKGVIVVAPMALGVAVVAERVYHTGNSLLTEMRGFIRNQAGKVFKDRVEGDMEPCYSNHVPHFLSADRGVFSYWDAHDIKLLQATGV